MTPALDSLRRTSEQMKLVRSLWSDPLVVDGFLSDEEMDILQKKISSKETADNHQGGNQQSLLVAKMGAGDLPLFFVRKMRKLVKDFRIRSLFAFDSNTPFMIHADSGLDPSKVPYKNFTFCLEDNRYEEQLVLYNARCSFSVSINDKQKFVYSKDVLDDYKFLVASPEEFVSSPNAEFIESSKSILSIAQKSHLLRHIPDVEKEKFEVIATIPFIKNRMIVFDSCQLHSGSALSDVQRSALKRMIIFTDYVG